MTDDKVIMLIEAKIQPPRRAELIEALREYLPLVRAEPGMEAFYVTAQDNDPNTFVFSSLQVKSCTRFPPAAGFHEKILDDTQERSGSRPCADESRRAALR